MSHIEQVQLAMYYDCMETPFGEFTIVLSAAGALTHLVFAEEIDTRRVGAAARAAARVHDPSATANVRQQLAEYFAGKRHTFSVPLAPQGTTFQLQVWAQLQQIAYGQTRTYDDLARQLGKPRAARAVGAANGQNPISILIPCHRLVGSSGSLTCYAGGLDAKRRLLELEAAGVRSA